MIRRVNHKLFDLRRTLADLATGPQALALLPLALLVGFWAGGGATLLVALLTLPALLVLAGIADRRHRAGAAGDGAGPVVADGRSLEEALDNILRKLRDRGGQAACLMLALDHFESVRNAQGARAAAAATDHVASRLRANLRRRDRVFFLGRGRFGIALSPARGLSADRVLQLAHRLRDEMQGPPRAAGPSPCFSACIGIGMTGEDGGTSGAELAVAASAALAAARDAGPGSVRLRHPAAGGAAPAPPPVPAPLTLLHSDLDRALANGEITAWFQPQLCTDTGQVSGVEALARWCHPRRGVVLPAHFLPRLERAGLSGQLQSVILSDSLSALGKWRRLGFDIPGVGVNFSPGDLNDPALADTVAWALDRHDLTPACLTAEILETVVAASPDDMIACNIRRLSDMGCRIDLDDFGTGHASISSLKRFRIDRLKIDRSFVHGIDSDPAQQNMVAAILTMAQPLELDTLAEGVETAGEHARLAELGCGHVQGYGIARPMPFAQSLDWLRAHRAKLPAPPDIRSGTL